MKKINVFSLGIILATLVVGFMLSSEANPAQSLVSIVAPEVAEAWGSSCGGCGDDGGGEGGGDGPWIVIPTCSFDDASQVIAPGESATLSWSSNNAVSASMNQSVGSVNPSGSVSVSPSDDTTYTLTVQSQTGHRSSCVAVVVVEEPVVRTCSLSIDRSEIIEGESVTITWDASGHDTVTVDGETVSAKGSKTYHNVTVNTTYRLHAEANGGSINCNQTVSVICLPPALECTMSGTPTRINEGESAVLTWTTSNAETASINRGIGLVSLNGNTSVSPVVDTTYILTAQRGTQSVQCPVTIKVDPVMPDPECTLSADPISIKKGESAVLTWTTSNADTASIDRGIGAVSLNGNTSVSPTTDTTYTLSATGNGKTVHCPVTILVSEVPPEIACTISATPIEIYKGETSKITWQSVGAVSAVIDQAIGSVSLNGNIDVSPVDTTTYTLTVGDNGGRVAHCPVTITVKTPEVTECTMVADRTTINKGESANLTWTTNNANTAAIDQGIGSVNLNDTRGVSPLVTTTYTLTAEGNHNTVYCPVTITVVDTPDPVCSYFTVSPDSFSNGTGGDVTLDWEVLNADTVSIDQGIGAVNAKDTRVENVTQTTTFTLTATGNGKDVTCPATVTVTEPPSTNLSCDSFTVSPNKLPKGGGDATLTWETTDAVEVTIDHGIGSVAVDGSQSVNTTEEKTYTLTAKDADGKEVSCKTTLYVDTGGGGGGSSSPRCDLDISKTKIKRGEEVTISWDNTRTNDMILKDNRGNVLVDTKERGNTFDEDEDSITVKPTKDTEYTMEVFRGSRDRTCKVKVELEDDVTVISKRNQEPQVAGISLSQVPYTGFEAGPFLTFIFYSVLALWAGFVAYVMIMREKPVLGVSLGGTPEANDEVSEWETTIEAMPKDLSRPAEKTVKASTATVATDVPFNLPTEDAPAIGYQNTDTVELDVTPMTDLENVAHAENALLSSDAIQFFMDAYETEAGRENALKQTIAAAKAKFPSEGGWLVLNRERVNELHGETVTAVSETPDYASETRVGASSLAEAVVSGNAKAAIDMIGARPMFALADAVADLDGIYRARKGAPSNASDMLIEATKEFTDEQVEAMISALTSALDGAYTDEAAAVKMAIMKASQVVR